MADMGLYVRTGNGWQLKDSGTCYKKTGSGNSECEIFARTGSGWQKIYPRYVSKQVNPGDSGGLAYITFRSNYSNKVEGKANQGWYGGWYGRGGSGQQIGNIYWRGGKPSLPGLVSIDRVRFEIARNVHVGWYNNVRTCTLHMSTETTGGSFSSQVGTVASSPSFSFSWNVGGTTTAIDNNGSLNNFFYSFFTNNYQSISLYNGESSGSGYNGEKYSTNYAGTSSVSIQIWATRQA